jgi:hypothetical protein
MTPEIREMLEKYKDLLEDRIEDLEKDIEDIPSYLSGELEVIKSEMGSKEAYLEIRREELETLNKILDGK